MKVCMVRDSSWNMRPRLPWSMGSKAAVIVFSVTLAAAQLAVPPVFAQSGSAMAAEQGLMHHDRSLSAIYTEYAVEAFDNGDYRKADEYAETALVFYPESPDSLFIRGSAAHAGNRLAAAEEEPGSSRRRRRGR